MTHSLPTDDALEEALAEMERCLQAGAADPQALAKAAMRVANLVRGMRGDADRFRVALERVAGVFGRASRGE